VTIAKAALCGILICLAQGDVVARSAGSDLEAIRQSADWPAERQHAWSLIAGLTKTVRKDGVPLFETWHGEDELFGTAENEATGIRGFSRTAPGLKTDVPVITYTLYNEAAYRHIVRYGLNRAASLEALRKTGAEDELGERRVPEFPADAMVLKTAWWPVARQGLTSLPVFDPDRNPPGPRGNPYIGWKRVVAVDPSGSAESKKVTMDFAGGKFPDAARVSLASFYNVTVDASLAKRIMADDESRKAVMIALGRKLEAGDHLALVAANLASREIADWIWVGFWWHDHAQGPFAPSPFAEGRPASLASPWRNYLMQTAFDEVTPVAKDGGPHVSFNPWLEGRFPDGGHGGGGVSNCMACHQRASYPPVSFLPVTRGAPDPAHDPAFAPGRVRTSSLWSLALHAKH
jgi:hypothetical protein